MNVPQIKKLVLHSAAFGLAIIGAVYLVAPGAMFSLYGISMETATELSMVRSAYGGVFIAFAMLFAAGAFNPQLSNTALYALCAFMGGFAAGRVVSLVLDGAPHPLLIVILAVEIFYAVAAVVLLRAPRNAQLNAQASGVR